MLLVTQESNSVLKHQAFERRIEGHAVGIKSEWEKYIKALLTSPMGITPSFSPFFSVENSANASLISFSSALVMLCSFASLDCRALEVAASAGAPARRFAGLNHAIRIYPLQVIGNLRLTIVNTQTSDNNISAVAFLYRESRFDDVVCVGALFGRQYNSSQSWVRLVTR